MAGSQMNTNSILPTPQAILLRALLLGLCILVILILVRHLGPEDRNAGDSVVPESTTLALGDDELQAIAELVASELKGSGAGALQMPAGLASKKADAYVCLRAGGLRVAEAWGSWQPLPQAVSEAVGRARQSLKPQQLEQVDVAQCDLAYNYRSIGQPRGDRSLTNLHRGIHGIRIAAGDEVFVWPPTKMLAYNVSFDKVFERAGLGNGKQLDEVQIFDTHQLLVELGASPQALTMFRGNRLVALGDVTEPGTARFAELLAEWMVNQLQPDGRLVYKYWPSRGEESTSNNMIRQFMATICLQRLAGARGDEQLASRAMRNLAYNLDAFYREEGPYGFIEYRGKRKLGAAALASLAILESPNREQLRPYEQRLQGAIDSAFQEDGSFRTFFGDPRRNDNQNFYPGEALLYWARLYRDERDPQLLTRFMKAFRYYREWHRRRRNPAFVPWHTQAYYIIWRITQDTGLKDFIFEMNDWLLEQQQWDDAAYPELRGRFYNPKHPEYGPPHASSTGVYLEGLVDAFGLARETGDETRAEKYRLAVCRGLRSGMQLQFVDDVDMFYVSKRNNVRGGLRTTVYNNEIRVDNVQHFLMAVLKILDTFGTEDYQAKAGSS